MDPFRRNEAAGLRAVKTEDLRFERLRVHDLECGAFRAFHALPRFDLDRPFRPWLLTITANLARNQLRSAGRYLTVLRRFWQEKPDHTIHPETEATQHWEAETLWQAVRRLGFADQQVIYYRYFLDLPVEETAAALNIAEGTVKSRTHRAVTRLRQVIEQDYPNLMKGIQA